MIDGYWKGFYEMDSMPGYECNEWGMQKFRVEAWFETTGSTITGRMYDLDREFEMLYADYYEKFKENFSWIEARNAESYIKEFPNAKIIANNGRDSRLEGELGNIEVNFKKSYIDAQEVTYKCGYSETTYRSIGVTVDYFGKLDQSRMIIKGVYRVVPKDNNPSTSGYFELHKK